MLLCKFYVTYIEHLNLFILLKSIFLGYTPLCEAVWQRYTKVVEVLLLSGARITHSHKLLHNAIIQRQVTHHK